jgi:hypothetical protein
MPAVASRIFLVALAIGVASTSAYAQQGSLNAIRNDVRQAPPPSPPADPAPAAASSPSQPADPQTQEMENDLSTAGLYIAGGILTSPFWAPHMALGDDFSNRDYFPHYPYDHTPGYLMDEMGPSNRWIALRLDADYVESFDHLDLINGHFLISTTLRFELDGRIEHLGEMMPNGVNDQLWIGDFNVMFRFAQSSFAEFRTGVGINWLNDPSQTDLGFNFTYGIDVFPVKPLILSTVLDAGTLGHAGLFRVRSTAGVAYKRLEFYTGYEYTDIGRTHWNGLIGGVRLWF